MGGGGGRGKAGTYFAVGGRDLGEDGQERTDEIQKPDCDAFCQHRAHTREDRERTYIRSWWAVDQGAAGVSERR